MTKKLKEMTDEEWDYMTEHSELGDALFIEEEEIDIEELARPDYGQRFYREPLWSEVLEGLWQGGTADHDIDAQLRKPMITKKDFDTVITLYGYANPVDWFVREVRYGVWDSNMKDFDVAELFDIVKLAHSDWKRGKKVLIRCQAGWNRSGLVMALVLIREGMAPEDAISLIRKKRSPQALCNNTFVQFLKAQTQDVWGGETYGATR